MRVLHVTSTYPRGPGDRTGPFLADLVTVTRDAGVDVRVVAPDGRGVVPMDGVVRFRYGPRRAEVLAYGGGLLATARGWRALLVPPYLAGMAATTTRVARGWRADVVHAHWWLPGGLAALPAGRLAGAPVVLTLHGSDVALAHRVRPLARAVARRAAAVTAVSVALAGEASSLLGVDVSVTAMPVLVDDGDRNGAAGAGGRGGLVAVGRLTPEKGFDVLLGALSLAPAPLTVIGDGPLRAALQAQATGLDVEFVGTVGRDELHARLAHAAAVVIPSRREGLGLVAVEAILLGTPVIASYTGGLPEALGAFESVPPSYGEVLDAPGGLLVPPGHVGALASALQRVGTLTPPAPLAVAAAARHRPAAVAAHHLALYDALLA